MLADERYGIAALSVRCSHSAIYIHHNPVKHGYVDDWKDWAHSSAAEYLERIGRERALEIWREYPVLDYGREWDPD